MAAVAASERSERENRRLAVAAKSPMVAVAWCRFQPRTLALAKELGGHAFFFAGGRLSDATPLLPLRYLRDAIKTWRLLTRCDPELVLAISPPVFCPLVCHLWVRRHGRKLVIDCHTDAFHSRKWGWTRPIHWWLCRRATVVTLHTEEGAAEVASWGARSLLLPDDVPAVQATTPHGSSRMRIVIAGSLDAQEPVEQAVDAARRLPDVEVLITGDTARVPAALVTNAPPNVVFTGWLEYEQFLAVVSAADVVAAFSLDPHIMNRAAFEAAGLSRALVLSDLPGLRSRFGEAALFCLNDPEAMAGTLRRALAEKGQLEKRSAALAQALRAHREEAMAALLSLVVTPSPPRDEPRGRRVLMISQHPYPDHAVLRRNVEHLLARGNRVDVICTRETRASGATRRPGLRIRAIHLRHRRERAYFYPFEYISFFLRAFPRSLVFSLRRYDVVQVDTLPDFLVFAALPARLRRTRVILFTYELMPEMAATRLKVGQGHPVVRLARLLERWAVGFADEVVVVNEACRRRLVDRGVDERKLRVVLNTQPTTMVPARIVPTQARLITHATLIERYGTRVAIEAVARLTPRWPELRLDVLGAGEEREPLEKLAHRLGLQDRVHFAGFLPWYEAMRWIRGSSLGLVPVLADGYGEFILPTKLLDYVSQGVPAVCSRLPAIEHYFPADSVAYVNAGDAVALANTIDYLLRHPDEAAAQANRAHDVLAAMAWERASKEYEASLFPSPTIDRGTHQEAEAV